MILRSWPEITEEDRAAVKRVLDRGVLTGPGPEAEMLEREWADYVGAKYAVAVNGGTSAIHIALAWLGTGPGDEVILPAFSYCGSYQPILAEWATPVFVDIDPKTFNIDPTLLAEAISPRTKAILPVHIHGLPADMAPIMDVANRHGIPVVEDACQAHGATYAGQKVGTIGVAGAFSLNATKTLPAGEGGLLVTDERELYDFATSFRYTGEDLSQPLVCGARPNLVTQRGLNYLMPELTAAIGRAQLKRLPERIETARLAAGAITEVLEDTPGLFPPLTRPISATHIYHKYRMRWEEGDVALRDELWKRLRAAGVPVTIWEVKPLSADPVFEALRINTRREKHERTQNLLDKSLVVGDEQHPLCVQDPGLAREWALTIQEVWNNVG